MSLKKRIQSIVIISLLSIVVVSAYYIVSYFINKDNVDDYYVYTDDEIEILKDTNNIEIFMFEPEFMFYEAPSTSEEAEESGFNLPSASKLGEKLGTSLRELITKGNVAVDTGIRADEYETVINGFMNRLDELSGNIEYIHDEFGNLAKEHGVEGDYILFVSDSKTLKIPYDDFFVTLKDGTKYAFDRTKVVNIINSLNGRSELETHSLVALSGFDTDGDYVSTVTKTPFVFQPITKRENVKYMNVVNQNGSITIAPDENGEFHFKNAYGLTYNVEKFSTMLMSGIYMLSKGKITDPIALEEYGLADEETATAIVEILTVDDIAHKVVIGNKTLDGKGYYAKYYTKDYVYIIGTDIESGLLLDTKDFLETTLVHPVTSQDGIRSVDNINVKFLKDNKHLEVVLMTDEDDDGTEVYSIWKILSPEELIPQGKEFGSPNTTAFTEFIQTGANLKSEKFIEYMVTDIPVSGTVISGISEKALEGYDKKTISGFSDEVLAKYGLLEPRLEFSYSYPIEDSKGNKNTIVSRVFISEKDEEDNYYAYSYLYTYNSKGKLTEIFSTRCITTLSKDNVKWLDWNVMDFNNQFLYKNYFYNLNWIEVEYKGEIKRFNIEGSKEKEEISSVTLVHDGTSTPIDVQSFKYMYSSILEIYMVDNYEIADEDPNMMCRITIRASGSTTEMIFYRATNTKAYYTLNGVGKHYVKVNSIFSFTKKYEKILAGEILTRYD